MKNCHCHVYDESDGSDFISNCNKDTVCLDSRFSPVIQDSSISSHLILRYYWDDPSSHYQSPRAGAGPGAMSPAQILPGAQSCLGHQIAHYSHKI